MAKQLLFVSPRFLFPADSGGKIRTGQILRGMKGGAFEITLVSPAPPGAEDRFAGDLSQICDRFVSWPEPSRGGLFPITRMRHLISALPIPVATDRSRAGSAVVARQLAENVDVAVFDFVHSVVLAPESIRGKSVLFTHNVEAEIFDRHASVASNPVFRMIWRGQHRRMRRFEGEALRRFDTVVAVADRDAEIFGRDYGIENCRVIPTTVDVDYFRYAPPGDNARIIYVGSMDSMANIDAMHFFMDEIWQRIADAVPNVTMKVIGRAPPASLVRKAEAAGLPWSFTGFVDDVRVHAEGAAVNVVPLRVGGGTRIKVFEGLAMGTPMVSTKIGVEGLDVTPNEHYLLADAPDAFAESVIRLLNDAARRKALSEAARSHVERNYSARVAAQAFERICLETLG